MLPEQSREISHHAIIGGSIAFVLALTELLVHFAEEWLSKFEDHPWRTSFSWVGVAVAAGLVAWLIVHFLIRRYEEYVRRHPIIIQDLREHVNGRWIQAVIQGGEVIEVTKLEISSSEIDGFVVEGEAYKVEIAGGLKKPDDNPHGSFSGKQGKLFGQKGFGFVFEGALDGKPVSGVTSYQFEKGRGNEEALTFLSGTFHESVSNTVFDVCGRNIVEGKVGVLPKCDVESAMKNWIKHDRVTKACDKSRTRI